MNGRIIAGLAGGAIVLAGFGGPAVAVAVRDGAATRRERAEKFAQEQDLALPADLVDVVYARLRRQALAATPVVILILVPLAYFYGYFGWRPVARLTRATALLPAGVTVLVLALAHLIPIGPPSPVWVSASVALSVFAILVTGIVEHVQQRVLQGRQVAGTVQELAFDDAFRAQTVRFLSLPSPAVAYTAAAIIVSPTVTLPGHCDTAHTAIETVWTLVSVGMLLLWFCTLRATRRPSPPDRVIAAC